MKKFQDFHVLDSDTVLERALKKEKITDIRDYQKTQLQTASGFCKFNRVAVDIGANYGIMSYNMSKIFDHVVSFEINPEVHRCLIKNVKELGLDNVETYPYGLGNEHKEVGINVNDTKSFSTHVSENGSGIYIKTLDSFRLESVDFIKIDAEGYEPLIIQGAMRTIKRCMPVIFYERKGHEERYGYTKNSVLEMLEPLGYQDLATIDRKNGVIGVL